MTSTGIFFEDVVISLMGVFFSGILIGVLFQNKTFTQKLALNMCVVCLLCAIYYNQITQQSYFAIGMEMFWCFIVIFASQIITRGLYVFGCILMKNPDCFSNTINFLNKIISDTETLIHSNVDIPHEVIGSPVGYWLKKGASDVLLTSGISSEQYDLLVASLKINDNPNLTGYFKLVTEVKIVIQADQREVIIETCLGFLHVSNEKYGQSVKLFGDRATTFLDFLRDFKPYQKYDGQRVL